MRQYLAVILSAVMAVAAPAKAETWVYPNGFDSPFWRVAFERDGIVKTGSNSYTVIAFAIPLREQTLGRWAQLSITCPILTETSSVKATTTVKEWRLYNGSAVVRSAMGINSESAWFMDGEDDTRPFDFVYRGVCPVEQQFEDRATITEPFPFPQTRIEARRRKLDQMGATLEGVYAELIAGDRIILAKGSERRKLTSVAVRNCEAVFSSAGLPDIAVNSTWMRNARAGTDHLNPILPFGGIATGLIYRLESGEVASDGVYALEDVAKWSRMVAGLC